MGKGTAGVDVVQANAGKARDLGMIGKGEREKKKKKKKKKKKGVDRIYLPGRSLDAVEIISAGNGLAESFPVFPEQLVWLKYL